MTKHEPKHRSCRNRYKHDWKLKAVKWSKDFPEILIWTCSKCGKRDHERY